MHDWQEVDWDEARNRAHAAASPLLYELVPIAKCMGRSSADDYLALCDLPIYTTSAMDGWAVSGKGPWKIVGEARAGEPFNQALSDGTCVRIATGAVIPSGTSGVARWEIAKVLDGLVHAEIVEGADIRPAGEEARKGDVLVTRGTKLTPSIIGLLASAGHDTLKVFQKPKVAILLLGDELQLAGIPIGGKVRDSLGPQLPGWLELLNAEVVSLTYVPDQLNAVIHAITTVAPTCNLIVSTGGTADGPRDHVHAALEALNARLIVDRVRSRPGHPALLAKLPLHEEISFLGLPGNPQSAIVGLMSLGAPHIEAFFGRDLPPLQPVTTRDDLKSPQDFTRLVLGNLVNGHFHMGEHLGSAMLRGLAQSSGFAVVKSGITPEGGEVRWLPLP